MSNVGGLMGLFFEDGRDTEGGAVLVTVLGRPRGHRRFFLSLRFMAWNYSLVDKS